MRFHRCNNANETARPLHEKTSKDFLGVMFALPQRLRNANGRISTNSACNNMLTSYIRIKSTDTKTPLSLWQIQYELIKLCLTWFWGLDWHCRTRRNLENWQDLRLTNGMDGQYGHTQYGCLSLLPFQNSCHILLLVLFRINKNLSPYFFKIPQSHITLCLYTNNVAVYKW